MARALLQLGIRELADKAGVDKMSVQRIESGRRAHPPTMAKIRETLIAEGIVFIGAVEPFHGETVALRWGMDAPQAISGSEAAETDESADSGDEGKSWDHADAKLSSEQLSGLRSYWQEGDRRQGLSRASQMALTQALNN